MRELRLIEGYPAKDETLGQFVEARWKFQYEILRDLKLIVRGYDYRKAFTTEFMPK